MLKVLVWVNMRYQLAVIFWDHLGLKNLKLPTEFVEHTPGSIERRKPGASAISKVELCLAKRTLEVLTVVFICVSLIVNEVKHLSIHFLAIWVSSSVNACSRPPHVPWPLPHLPQEEIKVGKVKMTHQGSDNYFSIKFQETMLSCLRQALKMCLLNWI